MPAGDDHGVRYVTVKVKTAQGQDDIGLEVGRALEEHKIVNPDVSSAPRPAYESVEVIDCRLAFEHESVTRDQQSSLWQETHGVHG